MAHEQARAEWRQELVLGTDRGVMGDIYLVGSDADPDAERVVTERILPIAVKCGIGTWPQLSQRDSREGMRVQPQYQPKIGLLAEKGKIVFDPAPFVEFESDPSPLDLHPDAAAGYYAVLRRASEFPSDMRLLKTHWATPACAFGAWPTDMERVDIEAVQAVIYPALISGHISAINAALPGVIVLVSADDPASVSGKATLASLDMMGFDKAQPALVALHNCGGTDARPLMESKRIDLFHVVSPDHDSLFRGFPNIVQEYVAGFGLFAVGAVPSNEEALFKFAKTIDPKLEQIQIRKPADYDAIFYWYQGHEEQAADAIVHNYFSFVAMIANEVKRKAVDIANQFMVGPMCGMGDTTHDGMRDEVYSLTDMASDKIRAHHWT